MAKVKIKNSIKIKLALVFLPLVIPIFVGLLSFVDSKLDDESFTKSEIEGMRAINSIVEVIKRIQKHRELTLVYLKTQDPSVMDKLLSLEGEIENLLKSDEIDKQLSSFPESRKSWHSLRSEWEAIKVRETSQEESLKLHNKFIQKLLSITSDLSDESNLRFDPEYTTYYLWYMSVELIIPLIEFKSQLQTLYTLDLPRDALYTIIEYQFNSLRGYFRRFSPLASDSLKADYNSFDSIVTEILRKDGQVKATVDVTDTGYRLYESMSNELILQLEKRVGALRLNLLLTSIFIILAFLVALFIAVRISRQIGLNIRELSSVMQETIREGKFDKRVKIQTSDELGDMAVNFNYLMATLERVIDEMKGTMVSAAKGDFSKRITSDLHGDLAVLKDSFNTLMDSLEDFIGEIREAMVSASEGDFSKRIGLELAGELLVMKDSFNRLLNSLEEVIEEMKEVMKSAAEGDFSKRITSDLHGDLAVLKDSFNKLIDSLEDVIAEIKEVMVSAAGGDFTKRIGSELKGELMTLKESINHTMDVLELMTSSMLSAIEISEEVGKAIEVIENGVKRQFEATKNITRAMDEINTTLSETYNSTETASQSASMAFGIVEDSSSLMKSFKASMDRVKEDGERISFIAEEIQKVAEQVNLLALNAAIEAARAGENGRGFAVVADEVRRLAEHVGKMASSVDQTIREVVSNIEEGYRDTDIVNSSFGKIRESVEGIREMLSGIYSNMEQAYKGMRDISEGMSSLEQIGNNNAVASKQVASRMTELRQRVEEIRKKLKRI